MLHPRHELFVPRNAIGNCCTALTTTQRLFPLSPLWAGRFHAPNARVCTPARVGLAWVVSGKVPMHWWPHPPPPGPE